MGSTAPKPPPPRHQWLPISPPPGRARWYYLTHPRRPNLPQLHQGDDWISGPSFECTVCGCVAVHGWLWRGYTRHEVSFYGFDLDSLSPMRAPICEVLEFPWRRLTERVDVPRVVPAVGQLELFAEVGTW